MPKAVTWSVLGGGSAGIQVALYKTWFSGYPRSSFHWINDGKNWLQMDKVGHAWTAHFITSSSAQLFQLSGYNKRKSALFGAGIAVFFQTTVEVFDGYSEEWGASKGDIAANMAGTILAGWQCYKWGRPLVPFRVTFHRSGYAEIRPGMLGSTLSERLLKDYNGQTYWLDFNPERLGIRPKWWPKWLGINTGYGAEGMLGGDDNIFIDQNGQLQDYRFIKRYRQYYVGPSISFGYLRNHRSQWLRTLAFITDRIRLPLPVMELSSGNKKKFELFYW